MIHLHNRTRIEPALACARQQLQASIPSNAHRAVRGACDFLAIAGPKQDDVYHPAAFLKLALAHVDPSKVEATVDADPECMGSSGAAQAAFALILENAVLHNDAIVMVQLDESGVVFTLDGPGMFPNAMYAGGFVRIAIDELRQHWTRHTRGARLDYASNAITLKFAGQKEPTPDPESDINFFECVHRAEQHFRLLAAGDSGAQSHAALHEIESALAIIDNAIKLAEPTDVAALLHDQVETLRPAMRESKIEIALIHDEYLPPIAVRRDRLANGIHHMLADAKRALEAGGSITIVADYNATSRAMHIAISATGSPVANIESGATACLQRIVTELHDGDFESKASEKEFEIRFNLPDKVGGTLEAWIPGFDRFAPESVRMLRLLKSGGPAPPEDLILGGVLENELERWLLPKLESPPAVNRAHEFAQIKTSLKNGDTTRLEKAVTQIKRGKPRKEICKPPYAAEIIAAYAADARGRAAIGAEGLNDVEIDALCQGLLNDPIPHAACLRLIAKAIAASA